MVEPKLSLLKGGLGWPIQVIESNQGDAAVSWFIARKVKIRFPSRVVVWLSREKGDIVTTLIDTMVVVLGDGRGKFLIEMDTPKGGIIVFEPTGCQSPAMVDTAKVISLDMILHPWIFTFE